MKEEARREKGKRREREEEKEKRTRKKKRKRQKEERSLPDKPKVQWLTSVITRAVCLCFSKDEMQTGWREKERKR